MSVVGNALYPLWKQALMQETASDKSLDQIDPNKAPYLALVTIDSGYVYSPLHQYFTSITNRVGTDQQITGPVIDKSVFKGDQIVYTAVTGTPVGALVIYRKNAGSNSTWRLVAYEDTDITGLPLSANGGNIIVKWNSAGIFSLGTPAA